jgi:RNA polymerase sigma factor (sigma-70 family)
VITTASRDRFESAAHAVRPLLVSRLRRAGASPEDAEDVAQEALLRAWDRDVVFVDDGDLLRWCTVVARRSHIDRLRRQPRQLALRDVIEESATRELEAVELRHVLGTVSTAMASLTERERASLRAAPATAGGDRATQVRRAVARHRARHRLRLLVGPFAALGAQIVRVLRRGVPAAAATTALAAAALTVTLTAPPDRGTPFFAQPPDHGYPAEPAPTGPQATAGHHDLPGSPQRMRPVGLVRPAGGPDAPGSDRIVGVDGPAESGATVDHTSGGDDDPLVCVDDPTLGHVCLPDLPQPAAQPAAPVATTTVP